MNARSAHHLFSLSFDVSPTYPHYLWGLLFDVSPHICSPHVRRTREALIHEYLSSAAPAKSCANCGALGFKIRKDGHSKVFQASCWQKVVTACV